MNAVIKVTGSQNDGEKPVVIQGKGNHFVVDDKHFIDYIEIDQETGMRTLNEITFHKEEVVIKRSGAVNSNMVFRTHKSNRFLYETDYGAFEITILTKVITIYNEGDYLRFNIEYDLETNGEQVSENSLIIEVKH